MGKSVDGFCREGGAFTGWFELLPRSSPVLLPSVKWWCAWLVDERIKVRAAAADPKDGVCPLGGWHWAVGRG